MNRRTLKLTAGVGLTFFTALLLLSFYTPFCDFYADRVYPYIADALGSVTAHLAFPLGEVLMYAGILFLLCCIFLVLLRIFLRHNEALRRGCRHVCITALILFLILGILYELNWFLVLRSSLLGRGSMKEETFTLEQLQTLRGAFAGKINALAEEVERDETGEIMYPDQEKTLDGIARAMQGLGGEFSRLNGPYQRPKQALCSQILDAMDIGGYTYPYTMEVTYNGYITDLYYPSLIAHEQSHHKGYYRENEAVFLGCLSLIRSEDPFLQYSGAITAYSFLDNAYYEQLRRFYEKEEAGQIYNSQISLSQTVRADLDQASREAAARLEAEQSVPKAVRDSAKEVSDVGWDTQGKLLDQDSYDGSVQLFLEYFMGEQVYE